MVLCRWCLWYHWLRYFGRRRFSAWCWCRRVTFELWDCLLRCTRADRRSLRRWFGHYIVQVCYSKLTVSDNGQDGILQVWLDKVWGLQSNFQMVIARYMPWSQCVFFYSDVHTSQPVFMGDSAWLVWRQTCINCFHVTTTVSRYIFTVHDQDNSSTPHQMTSVMAPILSYSMQTNMKIAGILLS